MAVKPIEIHHDALAELKSALRWYLERSESAADGFVAEIDRAIELIAATPVQESLAENSPPKRQSGFANSNCYRDCQSLTILANRTILALEFAGRPLCPSTST